MVAGWVIAANVIYSIVTFVMFVISTLQWSSEYWIDAAHRDLIVGKLMKLLHRVLWLANLLSLLHSIDPWGTNEINTHGGLNQFYLVNTAACLSVCGAAYILTIIDSVYSVLQERTAPAVLTTGIKTACTINVISGNVCIITAVALNKEWPTGLNLVIQGPLFFVVVCRSRNLSCTSIHLCLIAGVVCLILVFDSRIFIASTSSTGINNR